MAGEYSDDESDEDESDYGESTEDSEDEEIAREQEDEFWSFDNQGN